MREVTTAFFRIMGHLPLSQITSSSIQSGLQHIQGGAATTSTGKLLSNFSHSNLGNLALQQAGLVIHRVTRMEPLRKISRDDLWEHRCPALWKGILEGFPAGSISALLEGKPHKRVNIWGRGLSGTLGVPHLPSAPWGSGLLLESKLP